MLVKDAMIKGIKSVEAETTLKEIGILMVLHHLSSVPVVNAKDEVIGIISERDMLKQLLPDIADIMKEGIQSIDFNEYEKQYDSILTRTASDIMSTGVISIAPDTQLLKAVAVMAKHNFRRIPVISEGKLEGIISLGDIHRALFLKNMLK